MKKVILFLTFMVLGAVIVSASSEPDENFCDGLAAGMYADPDDCGAYYVCVPLNDGSLRTLYSICPGGLIYNPVDQLCDFKASVPPPCGTKEEEK
ncbi:chitin binding peritrophin-A domain-containing protein [Sphingobacterium paucimobilis]|uniref:Chitin-binding type-2 domain-containing protein n=1 Tax=Sphingobacterium paucimobilis HER1398 TaxID=1346330 RepID=U2HY21_9SPHI|nr:chitin binding peritrophin-A domain-containing protein [Sphingobacterium paucimobilis]ERJ60155.1 hypothetical protein M472_15435 [Sphingobacterium paucimobilis HER1398]